MVSINGFPKISLLEKINQHASATPNKTCCHSIVFQGTELVAKKINYACLINQTLKYAQMISRYGEKGSRVIISIEHPIQFLIAFLAVLSAKRIAVPVPVISSFKSQDVLIKRVSSIYHDCKPDLLIVDDKNIWLNSELAHHPILNGPSLEFESNDVKLKELLPLPSHLDEVAYLQYTSGSTGDPKGCLISYDNMTTNITAIGATALFEEKDVCISWLPLYHDMGLIGGLLTPIYWKTQLYLLTPRQFIARPICWLRAIDKFCGTITVGPTFGYHLVSYYAADKQFEGLDLSSLRLAYIGAEPISVKIAMHFIQRFQKIGLNPNTLYPCYGMAESTLAVTLPPINRELIIDTVDRKTLILNAKAKKISAEHSQAISFISVGHALPGHHISIVDPNTGETCGEREIGEIVVEGSSVSTGYFGKNKTDLVLKTGDLGYIANHELYIIDRIKDVIIIAGQNYYPSDIETSILQLTELKDTYVVCFSASNDLNIEELHVIVEVKKNFPFSAEYISKLIKKHINQQIGISAQSVMLLPRGSLERTSSGKIKRSACKTVVTKFTQGVVDYAEN